MAYIDYPCPELPINAPGGSNQTPHVPQLEGSEQAWVDDVVMDRTNSGAVKARSMFPNKKKAFRLIHRFNSQADFELFEDFYDQRRRSSFAFRWAGESTYTYTCMFAKPPSFSHVATWINASVDLVEV